MHSKLRQHTLASAWRAPAAGRRRRGGSRVLLRGRSHCSGSQLVIPLLHSATPGRHCSCCWEKVEHSLTPPLCLLPYVGHVLPCLAAHRTNTLQQLPVAFALKASALLSAAHVSAAAWPGMGQGTIHAHSAALHSLQQLSQQAQAPRPQGQHPQVQRQPRQRLQRRQRCCQRGTFLPLPPAAKPSGAEWKAAESVGNAHDRSQ